MAHCYNCGIEISENDKTRLCDKCKAIILPFVKFTDASTSSAVRRLVSNERNLRNAGVTDRGMEYLLRICEIHDRKKMEEREEKSSVHEPEANEVKDVPVSRDKEENVYAEVELPLDEPLRFQKKGYGKYLPFAMIAFYAIGGTLLLWFIISLIISGGHFDIIPLVCGAGFLISGYSVSVQIKMLSDLSELKKRFR